ncbi:hypothetical protein PSEHALCIP103_01025 [Pseudoalteromonas haloplanktis]|uniref:Uncharacterized protein n=1 Tax=Pseudoalteromonas haloplanktis TaxID=228 RepID=A0A9W4VXL7_PSEHA|nr:MULTISPECIES: hypothetical protein [Pseudoalteromonas]MDN3487631.1 hypothetical protein [Pseudoalteromonas sp. APC 3694]PHQ93729.1 MAG: hypothetical protein COB48_07335 [Pseudoalteromonas sp.]CAH9054388.1 hypothetical protein PSEHALCIP103_01025 [Pseudoalteromonas haloplanktis]|tara:strand:- start:106 stop:630 length:525 start_codon:yes stop_codon:yes gene_type:complete
MDKRVIAAELIYEAVEEYKNAQSDIGYIKSILLSGAAIYLVGPLIEDAGKTSELSKEKHAQTSVRFSKYFSSRELTEDEIKDIKKRSRIENRRVYNSLKHTGNRFENLSAISDLEIDVDFKAEAEELIWDIIDDYNNMDFPDYHSLPRRIIELLNFGDPMDNLPKFVCRERKNS